MSEIAQKDVVEIMRGERFVMLTCVTADNQLHSHPMTPQQVTDDADVWFFIGTKSEQAEAIAANPQVNLAFAEVGSWLSVAGRMSIVDDKAKIDELWNDRAAAWFKDGKDDPNLALAHFVSDSAQHWGHPGGSASSVARIVKSEGKAKGESGKVEL